MCGKCSWSGGRNARIIHVVHVMPFPHKPLHIQDPEVRVAIRDMLVAEQRINTKVLLKTPKTPHVSSVPATTDLASIRSAGTVQNVHKVEVLIRTRAKLDPNQRKLHLELDLVPGVKRSVSLTEVVLGVFGRALLGQGIHHHMSTIRRMLIGYRVLRDYQVPKLEVLDQDQVEDPREVKAPRLVNGGLLQPSPKAKRSTSQ
jgi:hypothetical protein